MIRKGVFLASAACFVCTASPVAGEARHDPSRVAFRLSAEVSLGQFGGVPYCVDLDQDGDDDILWLQSAGIFSSRVYDTTVWKNWIRDAERELFCLTATDTAGEVLWQLGKPWSGDRPFLSHGNARTLDCADIDGDGTVEIVCARGSEILIVDAQRGTIERSVTAVSDNIRTICLGHTGAGDWTILAKNHELAYEPHEYGNPTFFYDTDLELLKTADYLGAGHVPLAADVDNDGRDEFIVGYCLIDDDLETKWTSPQVARDQWNAAEMHVDDHCVGRVDGKPCILLAASNMSYLLDAATGNVIWKSKDVHPQHGQIGRFHPDVPGNQVLVYNKRSDLQLYDAQGRKLWRMAPPANFPLDQAEPCKRKRFHVFDPTTVIRGVGVGGTDVLIFTDQGWPYVIDGRGRRRPEFSIPPNAAQDWGEVPGRPDDYGYGYYARVADFDGDVSPEVMINDRRFAWFYEIQSVVATATQTAPQGEMLYNGIRLPPNWPPDLDATELEVRRPPYLISPPPVIPIDVGRQLFVDDFLIDRTTLKRTLHHAEPYAGNPIVEPDKPWEHAGEWKGLHGPYAIPFSDGVWYDPADSLYKMWYMGGLLHATCYATSADGIRWEKPSLDVKPGTNIVHPGNRDSCTVWLDLDERNPAARYKMFRFQKKPRRGLAFHTSADGVHWSDEVTWAGKCNDRTTAFRNPFRGVWVCSVRATLPSGPPYNKKRGRRYHEGTDVPGALQWNGYEDPPLWLTHVRPDPLDPGCSSEAETYNLDAVAYESLLLGLFTVLERDADKNAGRPKRNQVFAGFSRDGFHWHRPYVERLFGVSERKGDWNWGNVQSVGGCCLIVGDKLYFYYSGRAGTGRLGDDRSYYDADASTGLGFLRRDGFASMDAGTSGGTLTTRLLRFSGRHLFVNVDADGGELHVEVLDRDGQVIAPFSQSNSVPIRSDSTLERVRWTGPDDLAAWAGKPVRFRFHLRSGSLYAFWVSPDASGASHGYVAAGGPGFTGSTDTVGEAVLEQ